MVSAYGTFANRGQWVKPVMVTRIEDQRGNVLPMSSNFRPDVREAFDEATAYTMVKLLQGVIDKGTGRRLRSSRYGGIKGSGTFGGKTGTTQDNSDGWFMCFNPDLVTGCWVGADSRTVSFRSTALGQGANMALPMVGYYLRSVFDHDSLMNYDELKKFSRPKVPLRVEIDCEDFKGGKVEPVDSTGSNVFDM
jgi:penicillin-binding protein 1A